ncbi:MAG: cytochrome d ubiquinol oxidase subunit II [Acidobacteria bacterium]|nr:cytochrome d ubiquinol oxidase subunit II [Acidobacteriota bacterium]
METLWFAIAAVAIATYVVLDGFDFGAGILHLFVARTDTQRRQVLAAIGPFWDGNEVWLLATGGVLFLAFPKVLASGLSGFYFAIMLVLWVLILRGISIEFRSHVEDTMWRAFWDVIFAVASTLAPVLFGAALGNLLRGVPLDDQGWFGLSLFESFSPFGALGTLDWYTVLAGVLALAAIAHHGALFLAWKTDGDVHARSISAATRLFPLVIVLWLTATIATIIVAPDVYAAWKTRPLAWLLTAVFAVGLLSTAISRRQHRDLAAFLGSCVFLLGALAATAASVFPVMLRSSVDPSRSLTAFNAASSPHALAAGLWWWPVGAALAVGYFTLLFHLHRGKAQAADGHGY